MSKRGYDESLFRPKQREAAALLLEREFGEKKDRKSKDQIAQELGIARMTLYRWETEDENFIGYYRFLAQKYINGQLAFVYSKLLDGIKSGSMKGIELYLKNQGLLQDKQEITLEDKSQDLDEMAERAKKRLESLENGEGE